MWIPVTSIEDTLKRFEDEELFSREVIDNFEFRTNEEDQLEINLNGKYGKLLDVISQKALFSAPVENQFSKKKHHAPEEIKNEIERVVGIKKEISTAELLQELGYKKNNDTFRECVAELVAQNKIEYTCEKRNSKKQKLRAGTKTSVTLPAETTVDEFVYAFSDIARNNPDWKKLKNTKLVINARNEYMKNLENEDIQAALAKKEGYEPFSEDTLNNQLDDIKESHFSQVIEEMLAEKGLFSKDANKSILTKFRNGKLLDYIPDRESVYKMAVWFNLTWKDTEKLLQAAGLCFRADYYKDVILAYYIKTHRTAPKYYEDINNAIYDFEKKHNLNSVDKLFKLEVPTL